MALATHTVPAGRPPGDDDRRAAGGRLAAEAAAFEERAERTLECLQRGRGAGVCASAVDALLDEGYGHALALESAARRRGPCPLAARAAGLRSLLATLTAGAAMLHPPAWIAVQPAR